MHANFALCMRCDSVLGPCCTRVMLLRASGFDACMLEGADLPSSTPLERWDGEALDAPADIMQTNALRFAALLPAGVARFDAGAFRLGAAEAAALDPQQRLLLEQVAGALQVARHVMITMCLWSISTCLKVLSST